LKEKIKPLSSLKKIIAALRKRGKSIVFTNGCFDLLHYGHVKYLEEARAGGDILVVAVNSDASVRKIKGRKRPIVNEGDRLKTIAALESVDYVVLFEEDTPIRVIKTIKPDILIKGADWNRNDIVGGNYISSLGGRVVTIKLVKNRSTTNLIRKIAKVF
jgi:D-beta-D-heptose 7-phosphate kinase/D-beta-D-heptose 1-phosphate adenosyltransferase